MKPAKETEDLQLFSIWTVSAILFLSQLQSVSRNIEYVCLAFTGHFQAQRIKKE